VKRSGELQNEGRGGGLERNSIRRNAISHGDAIKRGNYR